MNSTLRTSESGARASDLYKEHPYLRPIFNNRADLVTYEALLYLKYTLIEEVSALKIKDLSILANCGQKLTQTLLRHFAGNEFEINRQSMLSSLHNLINGMQHRQI